jgi:hypothetical protein
VKLVGRRAPVVAVLAAAMLASAAPVGADGNDPLSAQQWALTAARAAPSAADGDGVAVAIIGDGVADHPDLPALDHWVCVGNGGRAERCAPGGGPGRVAARSATIAAGIVAARLGNGEGIVGIAPAARLIDLRVAESGVVRSEDVDAALAQAADLGAAVALVVLPDDAAASPAIGAGATQRALDAGMLVVGGAGTAGAVLDERDGAAVAVAAVDRSGRPAGSAPTRARWTLAAPGGTGAGDATRAVLGTDVGGGYAAVSGTWVAAAHVAGAAAVLRGDGLGAGETAQRLVDMAQPAETPGAPGRLDVAAARSQVTLAPHPTTAVPRAEPAGVTEAHPAPTTSPATGAAPEIDAPPRVLAYPARASAPLQVAATGARPPTRSSRGAAPLSAMQLAIAIALIATAGAVAALVRASRPIPTPAPR